ncbi:hypothetical protein ACFQNE_07570 [Gordonia phosphorivorans]|uniref:TobH protein n=1 Tax=Gordonia phosphorivorans TaxID=1056982 RepID=A0ABV6H5U9_9ACTN
MPVTIEVLDDAEFLHSVDRDGLLRAAAMSGAQVRAVAEAQSEGVLDPLADLRPRAVVVVTGAALLSARAGALVTAVFAARIDVPVVVVPVLPGWIGPLDVVVVLGADAGDPQLSDALTRAAHRRAELVVAAPLEGPLREAAGLGRPGAVPLIDLSPRLPIDPRFVFAGQVAALAAVLTGLTAVRLTPAPPALAEIAEHLDAEAAADHLGQESFHNQAKLLALRTAGHRSVWVGDTPGAAAVAAQVAVAFFEIAGRIAAVTDEPRALAALAADGTSAGGTDSLFYDPEFDGPAVSEPLRAFWVSTADRASTLARRLVGREVDVVTEQTDTPEVDDRPWVGGGEPAVDTPTDLTAYLVTVVRAQMAAAFAALAESDL